MEKSTILAGLTFMTLLVGLAWGFYQVWSVKDSKKKGSHFDGSKERPNAVS